MEQNLGNPNTFFARVHLFELPSCCFVFTVMCLEFLWKLCLSSKQTHKPVKCLKSSVVNDMFQTNSLKSLCRLPPQDTGWVEWVCNFTFGDLLVLPAQKASLSFLPPSFVTTDALRGLLAFVLLGLTLPFLRKSRKTGSQTSPQCCGKRLQPSV